MHLFLEFFSLFNILTFKNDACTLASDNTMSGTCMTSAECSSESGTSDGNCASGITLTFHSWLFELINIHFRFRRLLHIFFDMCQWRWKSNRVKGFQFDKIFKLNSNRILNFRIALISRVRVSRLPTQERQLAHIQSTPGPTMVSMETNLRFATNKISYLRHLLHPLGLWQLGDECSNGQHWFLCQIHNTKECF